MLASSVAVTSGCALLVDLSSIDSEDQDAAPGQDAVPDASDSGNLLPNPSFELGVGGCGTGWSTTGATLTRSPGGHSGAACLICGSTSHLELTVPLPAPTVTTSYFASIWIKATDAGLASSVPYVTIADTATDGGRQASDPVQAGPTTSSWTEWNGSATMFPGTAMHYSMEVAAPDGGGCILIDDVTLKAQ